MHLDQGKAPTVGVARHAGHGLRCVLAPNASPMTFRGTNTYLLGTRQLAVIDPGPDDAAHLDAILAALLPGQSISHIFVTHAHLDHSGLAARLAAETGAQVLAYGDAHAGRSAVMQTLAERGLTGGGEAIDQGFAPDLALGDGETIRGDGWQITAHWTPGHFSNHMCYACGDTMLTGDVVMGWASSVVSPPEGDVTQYMASCARLRGLGAARHLPGHGAPIEDPDARLVWLMAHRRAREAEIMSALEDGPASAATLAAFIYTDTPAGLIPAATRNVLAHLIDLTQKSRVRPEGELHPEARFRAVSAPVRG
ncbi:MBL fold metallo-hydrolase [Roseovarius sp. D22-M7]|uniref:MBL fold metallo-hydrolase n=1 Tax=Roseovarius sp. D22-M7 TaxID=3127116 RepID=UPI00301044C8